MGNCRSCATWEIRDEELEHEGHKYRSDAACYVSETTNGLHSSMVGSLVCTQGSKGLNQDSAILSLGYGGVLDGAFCGVFDGHGKNGHWVSEMVRNRLPELVLKQKGDLLSGSDDQTRDEDKWRRIFTGAFNAMDMEMKLRESLDCSLSGTTTVVVVKQDLDLFVANLGDSRAILGTTTSDGKITARQLTIDLKPGLPDEAERIRASKGRVFALDGESHVQRVWMPDEDYPGLAMSRSFGDYDLKNHGVISTPEVSHHRLSPSDRFLVLATDGVWDVLSNEEVVDLVAKVANNKAEAATEVVLAAQKAWTRKFPSARMDDCTALCLFFSDDSTANGQ